MSMYSLLLLLGCAAPAATDPAIRFYTVPPLRLRCASCHLRVLGCAFGFARVMSNAALMFVVSFYFYSTEIKRISLYNI